MSTYESPGILGGNERPPFYAEVLRRLRENKKMIGRTLKELLIALAIEHWIFLQTRLVPSIVMLLAQGIPYSEPILPYLVDPVAFYSLIASSLIVVLSRILISRRWQRGLEPQQRSTLSRIMSYVKPHWRYAVAVGAAIVTSSSLELAPPWILGILVIDRVIKNAELGLLPWVVVLMASVVVAKGIASYAKDYLSAVLGQKTIHALRSDVYRDIEHLPVAFFDSARTGELISRVVNDTNEMEKVLTEDLANLVANVVLVAGATLLLFLVAPSFAIFVAPVAVLIVIVVNTFKRAIKASAAKIRVAFAELTARGVEVLSGIRIVKSFRMEEREAREFHNRSVAIARAKVSLARLSGIYGSTVDLLTASTVIVIVWLAAPAAVTNTIQVGVLVTFLGLLDRMFKPLVQLSKVNITLQKAIAAADRVFEVMDIDPEVSDPSIGLAPSTLQGRITFDGVSFGYRPTKNVLENFSLVIEPGETVAVVGSSGAGKSTVVNLLLGFYRPTAGTIYIDDYPLENLNLGYLRNKIGLVLQEPVLFSGTIKENIGHGDPKASEQDIERAAKLANAHDFIAAMPKGYDTVVGERGVTLSVGQRQRIAIARALLKDPSILILDEATSNIDSESESLIQEALNRQARRRTMIVIGHRLSSVMDADRIVVLEDGGIVEVGTHEDLIGKGGTYSRLYEAQIDRGEPSESKDDEIEEDASARTR